MRKDDALYEWPINEIIRLTDSQVAENFAETLDAHLEASFISLTEGIRGLGADLAAAKLAGVHFTDWSRLHQEINTFRLNFPTFLMQHTEN